MQPLKIVVLGPIETGKTIISNFLADATEISSDYRPTQGVRILEFEVAGINVKNKSTQVDVELWDCSGDSKFESCWPAMRKDIQGLIFVYNNNENVQIRQLEKIYDYFIVQTKLEPNNCVVFFFSSVKTSEASKKISNIFSKVSHVNCDVEEGGNKLKTDFLIFLSTVMTRIREKMTQEENSILK